MSSSMSMEYISPSMPSDETNSAFSATLTSSIRRFQACFLWHIENFTETYGRKYEILSPEFDCPVKDGSKWQIRLFEEYLYPTGIQVGICLMKTSLDNYSHSVIYRVSIISSDGQQKSLQSREMVFRGCSDNDKFILINKAELMKNDFLQGKTLVVKFEMDTLLSHYDTDASNNTTKNVQSHCNHQLMAHYSPISDRLNNFDTNPEKNDTVFAIPISFFNNMPQHDKIVSKASQKCVSSSDERYINESNPNNIKTINTDNNISLGNVMNPNEGSKPVVSPMHNYVSRNNNELQTNINDNHTKVVSYGKDVECSIDEESLRCLSADLGYLYVTKSLSDATIVTASSSYKVHQAVLSARSDYFTQFCTEKNVQIRITDTNDSVLEAVLYYIYTGKLRRSSFEFALELVKAIPKFGLPHLQKLIVDYIKGNITVGNVTDVLQLSDGLNLRDLKMFCSEFVNVKYAEVIRTTKWNNLINNFPDLAAEVRKTIDMKKENKMS